MKNSVVNFKVSSALKNLIGKELITNSSVAVFELVKNSFDAKSNNIDVVFNLDKGSIEIIDDGTGMSHYDIINKWLFIGYSEKKDVNDGSLSGNKGIGRFSCDRLGSKLRLITINNNEKSEIFIDWDLFEKNQSNEIQDYVFDLITNPSEEKNGTIIEITNLRDEWSVFSALKIKNVLLRLLSPNSFDSKTHLNFYIIKDGVKDAYLDLKNDVFDYMKNKTIYIECQLINNEIFTRLFDKGTLILSNKSDNIFDLTNVYIRSYFMTSSAKNIFRRKTGIISKNYGDLFVYRNHFRVFPYGEPDYDTFGLNLRKTQGYNRYIGPRELLGWIDVVDERHQFKEPTSRDNGFTKSIFLDQLKELYLEFVHRPLEKYVELVNYGNIDLQDFSDDINIVLPKLKNIFNFKGSTDSFFNEEVLSAQSTEVQINQIVNDGALTVEERKAIADKLVKKYRSQSKENKTLSEKVKNQEDENKKLKREIDVKNVFISKTKPDREKILEHDLNWVALKIRKVANDLVKLNNPELNSSIYELFWSANRTDAIRKICLRTGDLTYSDKTEVKLGQFYKEYSDIYKNDEIKVSIEIESEFTIQANLFDLVTIFDNVISNAFSFDANFLKVYVSSNKISFVSDSMESAGLVEYDRIFDFGYTTRQRGTGMGLYIIKQIVNNLDLTVKIVPQKDKSLFCLEICKK